MGVSPLQLVNLHRNRRYFVIKLHTWFCLSVILLLPLFLEVKHKILLHLSIFYEYQQFFQHHICFSIQPPDYQWDKSRDYTCYSQWPVTHFSTFYQFILNMLFNHNFWKHYSKVNSYSILMVFLPTEARTQCSFLWLF